MRGTPRAKISVWRVAEAMVDFAKPQHETLEERLRGLGMHIMFVCTGNICRSPMGELLMTHYLNGTTVQVSSAGTRGLPMHPIDPSSGRLMQSVGIESSGFRSRRLTRQMADEADLILCFEKQQRKEIVTLAPAAVRYTFLLDDFANMCDYCARNNRLPDDHPGTSSVGNQEVLVIRPMIPQPKDIADPHGREFSMFCVAAEQTNGAIRKILKSMRKHRTVTPAPIRSQIVA